MIVIYIKNHYKALEDLRELIIISEFICFQAYFDVLLSLNYIQYLIKKHDIVVAIIINMYQ